MYTDIAKFLDASPEWVKNWLSMPRGNHQSNLFQVHEIARNIIYHLVQLAEESYWKAVADSENINKELNQAIERYQGTNPALTNGLYKKCFDLADKKREAFVYQVEIEKILLHGGFAHKKKEKDHIIYHIQMLANGLDPHDVPTSLDDADPTNWQPDYWGDEDPDDMLTQTENTDLSDIEWF